MLNGGKLETSFALTASHCGRIRDFFVDALYKSTFTYLLTYFNGD